MQPSDMLINSIPKKNLALPKSRKENMLFKFVIILEMPILSGLMIKMSST